MWQIYLQTRAEFVQPGDGDDDDDDDGDDMGDNAGMSTEEEASFYSRSQFLGLVYVALDKNICD